MAINKTKVTDDNLKYIATMLVDMGIKRLFNTLDKKLYESGLEGYIVKIGDYYSTNEYVWVRVEGKNVHYKLGYALIDGRYKAEYGFGKVREGASVPQPKDMAYGCEDGINAILKGLLSISIPIISIEYEVGSISSSDLVVSHSGRNEYTLNFI